jgi:transcriptional regulator with XRE-family HTH domain
MVAVLKAEVLKQYIVRTMPSQNMFARKIRISRGYLSQLLSGQRNASGVVRQRLLEATGMQFDELFEFCPVMRQVTNNKALLRIAARSRTAVQKRFDKRKCSSEQRRL